MSDPQVEDGYTRIANELLEAILRFPFSKRELLVVVAIIRKTYGYNKKADDMSGQQLADLTGLKRQHVNVCVRDLALKKVVLKRDGQYGQMLGINKKYSEWLIVPKQDYLVPKQDTSQNGTTASPKTGLELVPKQDTQKTTPKDNSKRHICASEKFAMFWSIYPRKKSKGQAEKAWQKIKPDEQLFEAIMCGLERAKKSGDWQKDGGKYIQYPATWLNAQGWEDEHDIDVDKPFDPRDYV